MYQIFKAEFLRYRNGALVVLAAQLCIWIFVSRVGPLLDMDPVIRSVSYLASILLGLAFGGLQMYLHKRKNDWTYLIQRPLSPQRIYLALAAAGGTCIALAIPTGWLVMIAGLDLFTERVVDLRHYLHALFIGAAGISAYLVGSLVVLSASRGAFFLATLLTLVLTDVPADVRAAFVVASLMITLLTYLNAVSFQPDLSRHLERKPAIVAMSVPMQFGIVVLLILATGAFYHIPRFIVGNHPDNNPDEAAYNYIWSLDEAGIVAHLLRDSEVAEKESLVRQAEVADYELLHTARERFSTRGQLHFLDEQNGITHAASNTRWVFSHDLMLLQGNDQVSGAVVGYVGPGGFINNAEIEQQDRFANVPFLIGDRYLQTRNTLYEVDFAEQILSLKFQVSDDERFRSRPDFREHFVALVSDRNVYLFDPQEFRELHEPAVADYVIPHPRAAQSAFMGLYRMVDGYLVVFHDRELRGFDTPGADVVYAALDGSIETLHTVDFPTRVHPAPIQHFDYVVSPVLNIAKNGVFHALDPSDDWNRSFRESLAMTMPRSVNLTALVIALLSIAGVVILARRIRLDTSTSLLWAALAFLFSLPALISFSLMNRLGSRRTGSNA